jgi:hypothetical protein
MAEKRLNYDDLIVDTLVERARRRTMSDLTAKPLRLSRATVDMLGVFRSPHAQLADRRCTHYSRVRDLAGPRSGVLLIGSYRQVGCAAIAAVNHDAVRRPTFLFVKTPGPKTNGRDEV